MRKQLVVEILGFCHEDKQRCHVSTIFFIDIFNAEKKVEAYFPEEKNNSPVHKPRRLRHTTFYQANSYFNQWIMLKIKMWGRKLSSDLRAYIS